MPRNRPGPCIKTYQRSAQQQPPVVSIAVQGAYRSVEVNGRIDALQEQFPGSYPAPGQPIDELALAEIKGAILAKLRLAIDRKSVV